MRILHVVSTLGRGGLERWVLDIIGHGKRLGWESDVLCIGKTVREWGSNVTSLGGIVHHVPLVPNQFLHFSRVLSILRTGGYSHVHIHTGGTAALSVFCARRLGIPVVATFHSTNRYSQSFNDRPIIRGCAFAYQFLGSLYVIKSSAAVTATSYAILDSLPVNGFRTDVTYPCISVARGRLSTRLEFRNALGASPSAKVLLHVGSFRRPKNHEEVVRVFKRVCDEVPDSELWLVGVGELRTYIEALVDSSKLQGRVRFLGGRDDIPEVMSAADALLLPSLWEGFGIVALEANIIGLPVVASRVPGLDEVVVDGVSGFLCDVNDTDGFTRRIVELFSNRELRERISFSAATYAEEKFSVDVAMSKLYSIYKATMKDCETTGGSFAA